MNFLRFVPILALASLPFPVSADTFSVAGTFDGHYVCDSVTAGVPSTWTRPVRVRIAQSGSALKLDLRYTDEKELGREYTAYTGQVSEAPDGSFVTGYFKACGGTFPEQELVRLFPAATHVESFSFAADGIWVSDSVPNIPGLTVQSCRWSLTRVSTDTVDVNPCTDGSD